MRDIILFAIIFGLIPFCFLRPWIGILVFSWISYMNPHRFTWGPAYDFPFAKIVAIVTIIGLFFTKDKIPLPKTRETILIILMGIYFTVTNFYAIYPEAAWIQWEKVIKILFMTLITIVLINDRRKLKYFVMVIAFSIGFLGVKGGIFSFVTEGAFRVYGPPGSFFADNNDMALALNMILPFLYFLMMDEENRRLRLVFGGTFIMSIISVVFTYSRGGFISLAAVIPLLLLKTRYKFILIPAVLVILMTGTLFIPEQWFNRIETIKTYNESRAAMGRINAWYTAWNVAKDRPFVGSGFEGLRGTTRFIYSPEPESTAGDVHSIYFEILGEHGFVAFGLFSALILYTFATIHKLRKNSTIDSKFRWIDSYLNMFQISLVAYMVGGLFLGRAYFDLFYHLVAMVVIAKVLINKEIRQPQQTAGI
ncbi:MAG: putative O-glycosylation ligase, exosortase A system-associated [Nitrospirota bacterium]